NRSNPRMTPEMTRTLSRRGGSTRLGTVLSRRPPSRRSVPASSGSLRCTPRRVPRRLAISPHQPPLDAAPSFAHRLSSHIHEPRVGKPSVSGGHNKSKPFHPCRKCSHPCVCTGSPSTVTGFPVSSPLLCCLSTTVPRSYQCTGSEVVS